MTTKNSRAGHLLAALRLHGKAADKRMTDDEQHSFDAIARRSPSWTRKSPPRSRVQPEPGRSRTRRTAGSSIGLTSEIAKLCNAGGVSELTSTLLAERVSVKGAMVRIAAIAGTKSMVSLARGIDASLPEDFAGTMLAEGRPSNQIRSAQFDRTVSAEEKNVMF